MQDRSVPLFTRESRIKQALMEQLKHFVSLRPLYLFLLTIESRLAALLDMIRSSCCRTLHLLREIAILHLRVSPELPSLTQNVQSTRNGTGQIHCLVRNITSLGWRSEGIADTACSIGSQGHRQ